MQGSVTFDRKAFLGDPALLAALAAHVRTRVPAADADDVVQAVMADALAATSAPDEPEALKRWVFGVARHKIADFYRRTRREPPTDDADDRAAPTSGRTSGSDLMRWAEKELPPGSEAKRTFEWMLREGQGEKLESIAASEKLPAPRVRKRVSRMREHFRARWAAYVAALAAAGLALLIAFYIFRKKPIPTARIVPEQSTVTPPNSAAVSVSVPVSVPEPPPPPPTQTPPPPPTTSASARPRPTSTATPTSATPSRASTGSSL